MKRLVAIDMPASLALLHMVRRAWDEGHAVLPLDQRMHPAVRRTLAISLGANELVGPDGCEPLDASAAELVPLERDDALVIATSGSTGAPKGVIHTHASAKHHAQMVAQRLQSDERDHWWLCLPAAHIGGFGILSRAIHIGHRVSVGTHVDESALSQAIEEGATHTSVVPTLLKRYSFSDWRTVLVGGARSGSLPTNAISTYGLTETHGGIVYNGRALDGVEIRLRSGRVFVRTPSMARSLRHGPIPVSDGWLDTGDLGVIDGVHQDGMLGDRSLRIEGRSDDLIVTGGNKVWPYVVEQRLLEHPLVADVVVRGQSDAEWGSLVHAWVVPSRSAVPPTLVALREHIKETLPAYYAPRRLTIVETVPRSALGKPLIAHLPQ